MCGDEWRGPLLISGFDLEGGGDGGHLEQSIVVGSLDLAHLVASSGKVRQALARVVVPCSTQACLTLAPCCQALAVMCEKGCC